MKKIIPILIIILVAGCLISNNDLHWFESHNSYMTDSTALVKEAEEEHLKEMEEKWKDYPFPGANMNYLIMRSNDPLPPDTIVDGIGYRSVFNDGNGNIIREENE